jgi:hypothetical protein
MAAGTREEEQFIHLVRLAWDLRMLGLATTVELRIRKEPVLLVPRAAGPLKVMALKIRKTWHFTWGRGKDQRVRALSSDAVTRVWEMAR